MTCDCTCHTGPYATCSVPGGCGSTGCGTTQPEAVDLDKVRWRTLRALGELPGLYCWLDVMLEPGRSGGEHVTASRTPPVPLATHPEALKREVELVLGCWAEVVTDVAKLPSPGPRRAGRALQDNCDTVARHVDLLMSLPAWPVARWDDDVCVVVDMDGIAAATELAELGRKVGLHVGVTKPRWRQKVGCPKDGCEGEVYREIVAPPGLAPEKRTDRYECAACGTRWTPEEWVVKLAALSFGQAA